MILYAVIACRRIVGLFKDKNRAYCYAKNYSCDTEVVKIFSDLDFENKEILEG